MVRIRVPTAAGPPWSNRSSMAAPMAAAAGKSGLVARWAAAPGSGAAGCRGANGFATAGPAAEPGSQALGAPVADQQQCGSPGQARSHFWPPLTRMSAASASSGTAPRPWMASTISSRPGPRTSLRAASGARWPVSESTALTVRAVTSGVRWRRRRSGVMCRCPAGSTSRTAGPPRPHEAEPGVEVGGEFVTGHQDRAGAAERGGHGEQAVAGGRGEGDLVRTGVEQPGRRGQGGVAEGEQPVEVGGVDAGGEPGRVGERGGGRAGERADPGVVQVARHRTASGCRGGGGFG